MLKRYADSSRDRMRHIFRNVPAIYGFSSVAPLGPTAAAYLDRYLQSGGSREVASGRASARVIGYFPGRSLTVARGSKDGDADAGFRKDVCQFVDDRLSLAQKVHSIHRLLGRDMAEVRIFLDRLERFTASLHDGTEQTPDTAQALDAIAADADARARYLDFLRNSDRPAVRARLIEVAAELKWLSPTERRAELVRMICDQLAHPSLTAADVDLVCRLNEEHVLDEAMHRLASQARDDVGHAAILACLGSLDHHARVLEALATPRDADVQIAQVYFRHHPIADLAELREITARIARMTEPMAQARALEGAETVPRWPWPARSSRGTPES
jgi:hypothetical protein